MVVVRRAVFFLFACALADQQAADTPAARQQALVDIQSLNADILASTSATTSLENWCRKRRLADDPTIVAVVLTDVRQPPAADQLRRLRAARAEDVRHRRVELRCGQRLLSVADNWYVPGRLTAEMNRLLDTTRTPFGRVVLPLGPYRQTFAFNMLWSPEDGAMPDGLFEHRAVLYSREQEPFSEVHEVYQREILASPGLGRR